MEHETKRLVAEIAYILGKMTRAARNDRDESRREGHRIDAAAFAIREKALLDAWNAISSMVDEKFPG